LSKHYKRLFKYKRKSVRTKAELIVAEVLTKLGMRYIEQKGFMTANSFVIADFYLPKPHKVVIEVDGEYHLNQKGYDDYKDRYYRSRGFKVLRITNKEVFEGKTEEIIKQLINCL
jgi:very-short-patch-repair endonuclease